MFKKNGRWAECEFCKTPIWIKQSRERWAHKFCSMECRSKWRTIDAFSGVNNPNWKGGCASPDGYIKKGTHRRMHKVILEKKLGRLLESHECTHHINGIRADNRPENLDVMTKSEHSRFHALKRWERWRQDKHLMTL